MVSCASEGTLTMSDFFELAAPFALATGIVAILLSLWACTAPPPRPAAARAHYSTHIKKPAAAPVLADARDWCLGFNYRENSAAFDSCVARWARAERFEQQRLRLQTEAGAR
jgi:hypothetical protein